MNSFWPLNDNFFTLKNRLKIALFYLNKNNRWTQGNKIKEFEEKMAAFCDVPYAVFVSSGSTANSALVSFVKDSYYTQEKNEVILPSVTWQTSCSPWIREGFKPTFIDISLDDLSLDLNKVEEYLQCNAHKVAAIFPTSLLGFCPNLNKLLELKIKYPNIKICMDNCESTFTKSKIFGKEENISSLLTSTTSTYFGHLLQSIEGGFIFTKHAHEYKYFLKIRNHGMVRSLEGYDSDDMDRISNCLVDKRFDFNTLGNNYRNIESNAMLGMCDLERANKYTQHRINIYKLFKRQLNNTAFLFPKEFEDRVHVPFALPIIFSSNYFKNPTIAKEAALEWCRQEGIETRPIISGNLLRQTCYQKYARFDLYPNAELLHCNGFYVGLHIGVTDKHIKKLTEYLNKFQHEE